MKIEYICEICDKVFEEKNECRRHEIVCNYLADLKGANYDILVEDIFEIIRLLQEE